MQTGNLTTVGRSKVLGAALAATVAGAALAIGPISPAHATLIASESFNYTSGTALAGASGGTGWGAAWALGTPSTNPWPNAVNTTNGAPGISATNLPYSTFGGSGDAGGSAEFAMSGTGGFAGSAYRTISTPMSATAMGTFWGSVEFKAPTSVKFQNYYQLMFNDTPLTSTNGRSDTIGAANGSMHAIDLLAIGVSPANAASSASGAPAYLADADGGAGVQLSAANASQHIDVFEINTGVLDPSNSAPAIQVTSWLDPNLAAPLGTPGAIQYYDLNATEAVSGTITGIRYQSADQASTTSGRNILMDEVKLGTTAEDVNAVSPVVPEPASFGLIALAGLGTLRRRRH